MKIKQNGSWKDGRLFTKRSGVWKESDRSLIKVNNSYKTIKTTEPSGVLYNGAVAVGSFTYGTTSYGFMSGILGSANPTKLSNGIGIQAIVTSNGVLGGAPAFRGLQIALRDLIDTNTSFEGKSPATIKLGGVVGHKIREERIFAGANLSITYQFPSNIPILGVWNIEW